MSIQELANKYIPPAKNTKVLKYASGETKDIIREVLATYKDSKDSLHFFAPHLKGKTVLETCSNIWNFWKNNITYRADPDGVQYAKTPATVWASKICDCKSFSIACGASLHALGIAFKFRFTSYNGNTTVPTHVYVIALVNGTEIILDCVWTHFNEQKAFAANWDYMATDIYRIEGLEMENEAVYGIGELNIDVNDDTTTQAEMDLALSKQGLEMEQRINRRKIAGINSPTDNAYQIEIEGHNAALAYIAGKKGKAKRAPKKAAKAAKKTAKLVKKNNGKGVNKRQAKKLQKAGVTVIKRKEGLLKRVAKGLKKVISTPARLALKTQLPKNSPFFLYLFLNPLDPKLMAQLPEAVAMKRQKALKYKSLIVDKFQMKEANFNTTVRNGIMNHFGKSPEAVLAQWMTDQNFKVSGIGVLPLLAAAGAGLKKLLGAAGAKMTADIEQFSPSPEDFSASGLSAEAKAEMAKDTIDSANNNEPTQGKGRVVPLDDDGTTYAVKPSKSTRQESGAGSEVPDEDNSAAPSQATVQADKQGAKSETFENSDTGEKIPPPPAGDGKNTGLMIGLAAAGAGLLLLAGNKGRKSK
jgi:hypothetical protein